MKNSEYFAILCLLEAHIHMAKANNILKNRHEELKHILEISREITKIIENAVSQDKTQLYLAN